MSLGFTGSDYRIASGGPKEKGEQLTKLGKGHVTEWAKGRMEADGKGLVSSWSWKHAMTLTFLTGELGQ